MMKCAYRSIITTQKQIKPSAGLARSQLSINSTVTTVGEFVYYK